MNDPVLGNMRPLPTHAFCGVHFPLQLLLRAQHTLHQLVGLLILSGTARRNRQHAHCLFIPCFNFHYYVSQEMHALANSYWHKKVFEFLPTFGETE